MMPKQEREARHLARQRGAGKPGMAIPSFGFDFNTVAKVSLAKRAAPTLPKTPIKKTPVRRRKSVNYRSATQRSVTTAERDIPVASKPVVSPRSPVVKSLAGRVGSARRRTTPPRSEDCSAVPKEAGVRKAKFYEHLSDEEEPVVSKLKKPSKTTRRKRKGITMPRPTKTKAKKATSRELPANLPMDPADMLDKAESETEIRTERGSIKRKHGRAPQELENEDRGTKKLKSLKQTTSRAETPKPRDEGHQNPQQLPSPVESGQDSIKSPPRTTIQRISLATSKMFGRSKSSNSLRKTVSRESKEDERTRRPSGQPDPVKLDPKKTRTASGEPGRATESHDALMATAPPDDLSKKDVTKNKPDVFPVGSDAIRDHGRMRGERRNHADDTIKARGSSAVKRDDDGDFVFWRGGRRKK